MTLQALLRGAAVCAAYAFTFAYAQAQTPPMVPDIPAQFERPTATDHQQRAGEHARLPTRQMNALAPPNS